MPYKSTLRKSQTLLKNIKQHLCKLSTCSIRCTIFQVKKAINDTGISNVAGGGVSATSALRRRFYNLGVQKKLNTYIPPVEYTTDNAAMIGIAGLYNHMAGEHAGLEITPSAKTLI